MLPCFAQIHASPSPLHRASLPLCDSCGLPRPGRVALSSFHSSDPRMGPCSPCGMEQQVWQSLQMIWLCRGVQSRMGTGWPGCQVLARRGWAGVLAWLADVGKRLVRISSPHPEQGRSCLDHMLVHTWGAASSAVPTSSHTTGSPQPPGPGKGDMCSGACSLWPTLTWACVWLWDDAGITERWQRPFCPLHWNLQGGVPSQGGGSCPLYTWCFHVSLVPWHC